MTPRLVVVAGPTASGKSALAVALAGRIDGEIVNADAMQLYRGLDIGAAKPAAGLRAAIPHHLYELWDIGEPASVAVYQRAALPLIEQIRGRGRVPILVGGSGLYVRAIVDQIAFPGTDSRLRERLCGELERHGAASLHQRLAAADPVAAAAVHPGNARRIVRALEVIELTGLPFSAGMPDYRTRPGVVQLGLDRPDLDERIGIRVQELLAAGFLDEVRRLERLGLRNATTAGRAIGYRQLLAHLDGHCTLAEAVADIERATRRFARRQRSWFRRDPRVQWLNATGDPLATALHRTLMS